MYGTFLQGQTTGFSDALSLSAISTALFFSGIAPVDHPEIARHILMIHSRVIEIQNAKERHKKRNR